MNADAFYRLNRGNPCHSAGPLKQEALPVFF